MIEKALVGTTLEEGQQTGATDVVKQTACARPILLGQPKEMAEKKFAFDMRRLWSFLETAQQDVLDEHKGKDIFTMNQNEVYFTTRLNLDKTYFMPFN